MTLSQVVEFAIATEERHGFIKWSTIVHCPQTHTAGTLKEFLTIVTAALLIPDEVPGIQ